MSRLKRKIPSRLGKYLAVNTFVPFHLCPGSKTVFSETGNPGPLNCKRNPRSISGNNFSLDVPSTHHPCDMQYISRDECHCRRIACRTVVAIARILDAYAASDVVIGIK